MPKTIKEHFTIAEFVKAIIIIGTAFGATSVSSNDTVLESRVAVLESRIDPMIEVIKENTTTMRTLIKTTDSLNIIIKMHIEDYNEDKRRKIR